MFCRNCAEVILDTDITCPKCGFAAGTGEKYCAMCGSLATPGASICDICGNPVANMNAFGGMQFQQAPQTRGGVQFKQAPPPFQQAPPQFQQAPQQFQQQGYQDPQLRQGNPYGQPGAQTRSADPNMYGQQQGQPNVYVNVNNNAGGYYQNVTYKSKVTAGVLGILFGSLGVHNFYLGYTAKGVVQLLMTICSCGALGVVSAVWGLVEGIMLLTGNIKQDGRGLPLRD